MLERSEDCFESALLALLQKAEEALPTLICERVLAATAAGKKAIDQACAAQFTKKRLIKEKVRSLRRLLGVLDTLRPADCPGRNDTRSAAFVARVAKVVRQSERLLKAPDNAKHGDSLLPSFFQTVHDFWNSVREQPRPSPAEAWKGAVEAWVPNCQRLPPAADRPRAVGLAHARALQRNQAAAAQLAQARPQSAALQPASPLAGTRLRAGVGLTQSGRVLRQPFGRLFERRQRFPAGRAWSAGQGGP